MREIFNRVEDEQKVSIEVYLDAKENQEENPWIFSVFIKFNTSNSSDEELEDFFETKESLIIALEHENRATYVGSRLVGDWSEIYFYAKESKELDAITSKMLKPMGYIYESNVARDKDWEFFNYNIFPTDLELALMQSSEIILLMQEEGDDVSAPREVEHYASFDMKGQKERFIEKAQEIGFKFKDDISSEEFDFGVAFTKEHNLTLQELEQTITPFLELIKQEHGEYELWSTVLQEKE